MVDNKLLADIRMGGIYHGYSLTASQRYKQILLREAKSFEWKKFADGIRLRMYFFTPPGHDASANSPCVLFFSGGMWVQENPEDFAAWAYHLAHCGVVCMIPEYRTYAAYNVTAEGIIKEGTEAWRWVYENARGLGIDAERISVAGADAGGLMALNAAMQPFVVKRRWWQFGKEDVLPLMPAAVVIFRGIVDPEAAEAHSLRVVPECKEPERINPCALIRKKLPPLFCVHGMQDPLLDYEMREWFCREWKRAGNDAEFLLCPHGDHTITHFEVNPETFEQIVLSWEEFMIGHGIWPEECREVSVL